MNKSKIFQIILFSFGLLVFIFTYFSFFQRDKSGNLNKVENLNSVESLNEQRFIKENNSNIIIKEGEASNIIEDLSYQNIDYKGNIFTINSKITKVFAGEKDMDFMEVVIARIFLINGRVIEIYSDKAIYDNNNYNTKFIGNVTILENENKITSNNLDFFFDKNLVTIYNNVKYKGYNKLLMADKVDINLLDQKTSIYMNDKMNKVKINLKN